MRSIGRVMPKTVAILAGIAVLALGAAPASAKVEYGIAPQTKLGPSDYEMMRQSKLGMIRLGLGWGGIQGSPGNCTPQGGACDWSYPDAQIAAASANGFKVMLPIYGSAPFVNSEPKKPPTNDIAAWTQFVSAAAQRYGQDGAFWKGPYQQMVGPNAPIKPVRNWQIWNEQSSFQFFKPKPNPKKYAKILKPAGEAIHAVDRKAEVQLGGMFPDTGPKGIRIEKYLSKLYKVKGIKKSFDAAAVHPYAKNPKQLVGQVNRARKAMNKAGDKKAKVWITELGYSSGKKPNKPVVKKSAKKQAKALTSSFKALKKARGKLKLAGVVWFTWQDTDDPAVCRFCTGAGLLDINGQLKPAYHAFLKVTR
jgi:hypothetical protein